MIGVGDGTRARPEIFLQEEPNRVETHVLHGLDMRPASVRSGDGIASEAVLPEGSAPPPIVSRYFPDRVHEFVWRNWNAVEPAKLAKILGARVEEVAAIANSMGLPPAAEVPPEMRTRGYYTLIKRNWHLLPYEQLLELLEMTPEQMSTTLREDDFLWIKLGTLKPKCDRLRYSPPDAAARRREAEIRRVVKEEFGREILEPVEPRFHFVQELHTPAPPSLLPKAADDQILSLRLIYSYLALFGDPLLNPKLDPFPDGLLQRLSALGINGVWLHVVLRDLVPGGTAFPEFGEGHQQRLANLRALVERAKKYGIGVYLYINEPRGMPKEFFRSRPEMAGVHNDTFGLTAMCTSHPAVCQWMGDALTYVFRQVPDLAGVFTITASENLTNCASRGQWRACPHCKNRSNTDIIVEVNTVIEQGVHRGNPKAKVIVWDWGWHSHGDAPDIITRLPKSVWLMSVSEWDLPLNRGGVRSLVGEYCMSEVGPGPRALRHWKLAQEAGLKTFAKVQVNITWEMASVPYLPVMDLVAAHCHNLASAGLDGMMLSWSLGGYPSPNLEIAARFCAKPVPKVDEVLDAVAAERYGPEGAPLARKAWTAFSTAYHEHPYCTSALYRSPLRIGPANPLYFEKTGYRASPSGGFLPYDDVAAWCGPYPPEVFAAQFEKMAKGWRSGLAVLQEAVRRAPAERREETRAELRFAEVAAILFSIRGQPDTFCACSGCPC